MKKQAMTLLFSGKKLLKMTEECTFYCLPHNEIRHYSTQFFFLNSFLLAKATKTFFWKERKPVTAAAAAATEQQLFIFAAIYCRCRIKAI
jgi:hypothetical protein